MEEIMDNRYKYVLLMDENREKCLKIGFFGYDHDMIEKYMKKHYIDINKQYKEKWSEMKYMN